MSCIFPVVLSNSHWAHWTSLQPLVWIYHSLIASMSFSTLSGDSSFPFNWGLFLCLLILGKALLVCFWFLNCSALTPCLCGVNFYGKTPLGISGAVSLISWTWHFWDALYALYFDSLDVIGFWLLFSHSFMGLFLQLDHWGSLHPPCLVCCCAGTARTKPHFLNKSSGNNPTLARITPTHNSTINGKWTSINKGIKRLRLL